MFSSIVNRYDLLDTVLSFNRDKRWREFTVSCAQLNSGIGLDIATGTGKLALELDGSSGGNHQVVGVDFCEEMLHKARSKVTDNIELALADAERLPFADDMFDCAVMGFALRNVTNIPTTLREMARVVKAGGIVVCLEFSRPSDSLFGMIYRVYLSTVLPLLGWLISGSRGAYTYLRSSIIAFYTPEELKQMMEDVGLRKVHYHSLTMGIVNVHVGTK